MLLPRARGLGRLWPEEPFCLAASSPARVPGHLTPGEGGGLTVPAAA